MKQSRACKQKTNNKTFITIRSIQTKNKQEHTNRSKQKKQIIITNNPQTLKDMQTKTIKQTKSHRHPKQSKTATNIDTRATPHEKQILIIIRSNQQHETIKGMHTKASKKQRTIIIKSNPK